MEFPREGMGGPGHILPSPGCHYQGAESEAGWLELRPGCPVRAASAPAAGGYPGVHAPFPAPW